MKICGTCSVRAMDGATTCDHCGEASWIAAKPAPAPEPLPTPDAAPSGSTTDTMPHQRRRR
jgi:hypothetical protein